MVKKINVYSKSQQSEMERWKNLASERLIKLEQLSAQIKERHNHEVSIVKSELKI